MFCDKCGKRANVFTLIGTFYYCDKCVGLVRAHVKKLLGYFNKHPNILQTELRTLYRNLEAKIAKYTN